MPIYQEILKEINSTVKGNNIMPALDSIRRKYLGQLSQIMGKPVIVYAANFNSLNCSISLEDVHSFMSMCCGLRQKEIALVIHTPGGAINAIEALVKYIRTQFDSIDMIVPMYAFSAGTMWCCACEKIYMGKNSFLGPIDPQISFYRSDRQKITAPAQSIIDEFDRAKEETKKNPDIVAYNPILLQYAPSLVTICKNAVARSKILVKQWLEEYHGLPAKKASSIANWLGQHNKHKDHGRPLSIKDLNEKGMNVIPLESDQALQDAALSLYHAIDCFFTATNASKIIENTANVYIVKP